MKKLYSIMVVVLMLSLSSCLIFRAKQKPAETSVSKEYISERDTSFKAPGVLVDTLIPFDYGYNIPFDTSGHTFRYHPGDLLWRMDGDNNNFDSSIIQLYKRLKPVKIKKGNFHVDITPTPAGWKVQGGCDSLPMMIRMYKQLKEKYDAKATNVPYVPLFYKIMLGIAILEFILIVLLGWFTIHYTLAKAKLP